MIKRALVAGVISAGACFGLLVALLVVGAIADEEYQAEPMLGR